MLKITLVLNILLMLALTTGFTQAQDKPYIVNHVIIVGVDGMSPNGIQNANTPNMDFMMKNGSYSFHARAVLPSSSSSNWSSMIMGAGTEVHGITSNDWGTEDYTLPPVITGMEKIFPTIFGILRQQKPKSEIGAVYHWDGFGRLFEKSAVNYDYAAKDQYDTAIKTAEYIKAKKPNFTFVQLDHVDGAGHGYGHGSHEYFKAVSLADSLIGIIFKAAEDAGIGDDRLFIVTSDHGGIGFGHGGETLDEVEIPFLLYGKGVKKNHIIKLPVYTYDNASTVAFAFGLEQPYAWTGRPVKTAFEGFADPIISNEKPVVPQPIIYPPKKFYSPAGGLFVDQDATVEIKYADADSDVRYTIDGLEPNNNSPLYSKPFVLSKSAIVKAKTFKKDGSESPTVSGYFRIVKSNGGNGIKYSYYEIDKRPPVLPVFESMTPIRTGKAFEFRLDQLEHRNEEFAVVFEAFLKIDTEGDYKFYTLSDDGSKLYIDGKEIVDNDGDHGTLERSGGIKLTKGMIPIKVKYFNGGGGSWLDVFYKGPGIEKQIITADKLYLENK